MLWIVAKDIFRLIYCFMLLDGLWADLISLWLLKLLSILNFFEEFRSKHNFWGFYFFLLSSDISIVIIFFEEFLFGLARLEFYFDFGIDCWEYILFCEFFLLAELPSSISFLLSSWTYLLNLFWSSLRTFSFWYSSK